MIQLCRIFVSILCLGAVGAAQSAPAQQDISCTFESGRSITLRYERPSPAKQVTYSSAWSPGPGPMLLFSESPLKIGSASLETGAYAIYLLPDQKKPWSVVVSKDVKASTYQSGSDVAKVAMSEGQLPQAVNQPTFTLVHSAPKQCSLTIEYKQRGFWLEINEK